MPTTPPPMAGPVRRKPVLSPLLLSSLVYPGSGQLVQRRWWAAAVFIPAFTAGFVWFMARVLAVLQAYYDLAFNFETATGQAPSVSALMTPFVVTLLIYLGNLVDTALGNRHSSNR